MTAFHLKSIWQDETKMVKYFKIHESQGWVYVCHSNMLSTYLKISIVGSALVRAVTLPW